MSHYAPILLVLLMATAIPTVVWYLSRLLRPNRPSAAKCSNYECGITTTSEALAIPIARPMASARS